VGSYSGTYKVKKEVSMESSLIPTYDSCFSTEYFEFESETSAVDKSV